MIDITTVDHLTHRSWGTVKLTETVQIWCEDVLGYRPTEQVINLGGSPENARWHTLVWFRLPTDEMLFRIMFARELLARAA